MSHRLRILSDTTTSPEDTTYAIAHASTALLLKRRYPRVGLWPLLIAVQLVELLWVLFNYAGIEHAQITPDAVHLDFIPYSHSIGTGVLLAALVYAFGKAARRTAVGVAIALGILSHVLLDIVHHEPNIALLPMAWGPRIGLNLQGFPIADFFVELVYCVACWKIFGGTRGLLIAIVVVNLLSLPLMFPRPGSLSYLSTHPNRLPSLVLIEIIGSWLVIFLFAGRTLISDRAGPRGEV